MYILEIWNVKLYDYPELILIFYRLVTFKNLLNTLPSQSDPLHVCSKVEFTGTADLMALFPVQTNPRWRRLPSWKNFKWPYLRNRLPDPLHVWF